MRRARRFRTRVRAWLRPLQGWKIYALSALLALPEILDGLGAIDLSSVLPAELCAKVSVGLAVARLLISPYLRNLAAARAPRDGGGR